MKFRKLEVQLKEGLTWGKAIQGGFCKRKRLEIRR
jgi:hypothetical protein